MITVLNPLKAQDVADTITLSPEDNSKAWDSRNLLPTESATLTVEVNSTGTNDGKDYTIKGSPSVSFESGNTLWSTVSTGATSVVIKALNGGREPETAVAVVSATWSTESTSTASGGGGGTGNAEELLEGYVRAYAYSQRTTFTWTFDPRMQFANGTDTIDFTAAAAAGGATLDMPKFAITGPAGWTIQYSASNTEITGTVKSTTPGKGALKIMLSGLEQGTSDKQIAFAKFDMQIAECGSGNYLKEDREPGGGNAAKPHEMDPGGVVIVPMEVNGSDPTPGKRAKLLLKGHSTGGGTYTLTTSGSDKVKIYANQDPSPDETPVDLSNPWQASEFASDKTFWVGSDAFAPGDASEEATLTFKYKLPLESGPQDFELKDDLKVVLLPVEVNCPELYMFAGHTGDKVELCKASGTCEWMLKTATPAIGTFDHPTDLACSFTATTKGKNTIQLVMGGNVVWEKPTEILDLQSREAWGAKPVDMAHMDGTMPSIAGATFHHSANTNDGIAEIQRIQNQHQANGIYYFTHENWGDIGYHFVMSKNGTLYVGRELEAAPGDTGGPYTLGAHVKKKNTPSGIGICMLGNYDTEAFSAAHQKDLEKSLAAICRRYNLTSDEVSFHSARAAIPPVYEETNCPGANVRSKAKEISDHVKENLQ